MLLLNFNEGQGRHAGRHHYSCGGVHQENSEMEWQ